jgi:predicted acetyltransferase
VPIRITTPAATADSWNALSVVGAQAFGHDQPPRDQHADAPLLEFDRTLLASDARTPVGSATVFSLNLSVPGGSVPTAGVSWVAVVPTHRRRGIMKRMLRRIHDDVRDRGNEPILALWASQGGIYERFGYGVASRKVLMRVPHTMTLTAAPTQPHTLSIVTPSDDQAVTQPVYDAVRARRPGMLALTAGWHRWSIDDSPEERGGASSLQTFVVSDDQGPQAYARARYQHHWPDGFPDGTLKVQDLAATNPASLAALYRALFSTELMARTQFWNLPTDDPLHTWLADARELPQYVRDQLLVRLVDVDVALTRRRYSADADVVVDVRDRFHPWNEGTWQISVDAGQATVRRSRREADLGVDASVLGAAYLGSTRLTHLADCGQVDVRRPAALTALDLAFSWPHEAWCTIAF